MRSLTFLSFFFKCIFFKNTCLLLLFIHANCTMQGFPNLVFEYKIRYDFLDTSLSVFILIWRNPFIITQNFHCSKLQYRGSVGLCVSTGYCNAHIATLLLKIPQEFLHQLPHQGRKSVFNLKIDGNIAFVYFARVLHPYNKLTLVCNGLYDLFSKEVKHFK